MCGGLKAPLGTAWIRRVYTTPQVTNGTLGARSHSVLNTVITDIPIFFCDKRIRFFYQIIIIINFENYMCCHFSVFMKSTNFTFLAENQSVYCPYILHNTMSCWLCEAYDPARAAGPKPLEPLRDDCAATASCLKKWCYCGQERWKTWACQILPRHKLVECSKERNDKVENDLVNDDSFSPFWNKTKV